LSTMASHPMPATPPRVDALPGLGVPILLVVFNRPETTKLVFESIRGARPAELFVAADGPRSTVDGEKPRCEEARRAATDADWPCTVTTLFRHTNVGLATAMSEAITWFFKQVEWGIVLEDDCVASASFYRFCAELLELYEGDPRVMHLSGDNFQYGRWRGDASYYFSSYAHCWGWATWRRAWKDFGFHDGAADAPPTVWAKHWEWSIRRHGGVSILPNVNLVTNIGFGAGATHTTKLERYSFLRSHEMEFPLRHPRGVKIDRAADTFTYYVHFRNVRLPRLVPLYQALDLVIRTMKRIKRGLMRFISAGANQDSPRSAN
jgi:hypothetical protein